MQLLKKLHCFRVRMRSLGSRNGEGQVRAVRCNGPENDLDGWAVGLKGWTNKCVFSCGNRWPRQPTFHGKECLGTKYPARFAGFGREPFYPSFQAGIYLVSVQVTPANAWYVPRDSLCIFIRFLDMYPFCFIEFK